jgi:hypothetical protein
VSHNNDNQLINHFLPDTSVEYCVHGYRGNTSATLELLYLWGAPVKDWSVGFTLSIRDREARKVLSSLQCMNQNDGEFLVRRVRIAQASLLSVMTYAEKFCQH